MCCVRRGRDAFITIESEQLHGLEGERRGDIQDHLYIRQWQQDSVGRGVDSGG